MMRSLLWLLVAGAATLRPGPTDQALPFADLVQGPARYLGHELTLVLQVDALVEDWEPYLTRFGPERYLALRAWADEQLPWIQAEYDAPSAFVFLPRGGELEQLARAAQRHQRFAAQAVVRELFAGRAWIEVTGLVRLEEEIGEGTLLHAVEGLRLRALEAFDLAADQLDRALAAPLPAHARAALEALAEDCRSSAPPER